jgi:predicted permease
MGRWLRIILSDTADDVRHAARMLARNRAFTVVVVAALALGIGATTAIFTVVNNVLLQPLRYRDAGRIVTVATRWKNRSTLTPRVTGGDLVDVAIEASDFSAFSSYFGGEVGVQVGGRGEFTGVYWINPAFLRVFSVPPVAGRTLEENDAESAAMVSLPFAQRTFGDGAAALGKIVRVENQAYEIAGVLPAGFQFPEKADIWLAGPTRPENLNRTAYNYYAVAKLRPDVTLEAAQAQLNTIAARLEAAYPDSNRDKTFAAIPLQERLVGGVRSTLYLLLGAVGLVLLIACANVANLLLARTPARAREMAVRAALGASRWRVVRQLTVENLLLALVAAAAGVVLAQFGIAALLRAAPDNLPRLGEVRLDRAALLFAVAASLVSSVVFGLAPAWQAARIEVTEALKQGGSRGVVGRGSHGLRHGLIVAEIALSFVLATGAGLLFRSFVALTNVQLGFRSEGMLVMYAHAPAHSMTEYLQVGRQIEGLLGQVRGIPGVTSAAAVMGLPTGRYGSNGFFAVEGRHEFGKSRDMPQAGFRLASPGYFGAMGVPVLRGRDFTAQDVYDAPFVATVSAALVRQVFPHDDPIGQKIQLGLDSRTWVTIVGIVGDVRASPATAPGPEIYMPLQQHPTRGNEVEVVVRTSVPPASLSGAVRQKVQAALPETATEFTTMQSMLADSVATPHFRTILLGVFAALALLLAMAGVYGVMAQVTAERTAELGVRLALGATPGGVMWLILRKAGLLAVIGLAIGLAGSMALGRMLAGMLFGLQPTDAVTYTAVLIAVGVTTLVAAAGPARRAGRINPVEAMREE